MFSGEGCAGLRLGWLTPCLGITTEALEANEVSLFCVPVLSGGLSLDEDVIGRFRGLSELPVLPYPQDRLSHDRL